MDKNKLGSSVIGQEFVNGKTIFIIKNNKDQIVYNKSAYELYSDNFSLQQFNFKDLLLILSTAVQEQTIEDLKEKD